MTPTANNGQTPPALRPEALSRKPFPTAALPEPLRTYATSLSDAMGVDASFVALPTLAALEAWLGERAEGGKP